ncbi:hypothetical protein Clacol_001090 [Clathrus columnatus]|uniref:N-acetyltransferase domain-containing protein n=1 Tax=Clathrus columnatus TaxID=1419009 RepID=A0AAV5A2C7_9AGAM|nr:hypothetical protein Clacol_001090 [Clathrus columnatus]
MEKIEVRQLVNPTPGELDAASETLGKAFHNDTFEKSCIGGNYDHMHAFQRAIIAAAVVGGGQFWVAKYGDHDFAGAAVWFGPQTALMHTPEQGEAGFNALLGSFPEGLLNWWVQYFLPKYETFTTGALGEGTKLGAWHLQQIGVLPEYHGKGIAKALIKAVENKPEAAGSLFVLEAEFAENLPIYEKLGYAIKAKDDFNGSVPDSDFPMWVLAKQL